MVDIPIIISTPGLHSHVAKDAPEYPFTGTSAPDIGGGHVSMGETIIPKMISHATQTDPQYEKSPRTSPRGRSPNHSRSNSRSRQCLQHPSWAEQLLNRLSGNPTSHHYPATPVAVDAAGHPLLAAPGSETPKRPTTPRADLYKGQSEANFGMTFEGTQELHFRKVNKPAVCAHNYEDQKHRMMMDWLERRA